MDNIIDVPGGWTLGQEVFYFTNFGDTGKASGNIYQYCIALRYQFLRDMS